MIKKLISIVTPCYNEESNIELVYTTVKDIFEKYLPHYEYEHLFIDNASVDSTLFKLKNIAKKDKNVKIIVNSRNFGWIRSPYHGIINASGDAVIPLVADLQDPPEIIPEFINKWEQGSDIVVGIKNKSEECRLIFRLRRLYYSALNNVSEIEIIENYTGFGLYDIKIIKILRDIKDPYPFFRGIIPELGYKISKVPFVQPKRYSGKKKSNIYNLYDVGILGLISNSKLPLRLATISGFVMSVASILVGISFFIGKILFWNTFQTGIAPLLIGNYFFFGVILLFIGILGEYIAAIYTQVLARPRVYESERINF